MIKLTNVSKKFGDITALKNVTFEIGSGDFVFITGLSGAGKTTLLKLLLADIYPTEGKVIVFDQDTQKIKKSKIPEFRQEIGVVFQDFKLLNDRTVFENIALPLQVAGKKKEDVERHVKEVLELVGLSERVTMFPAQLAGGELQRVCLARAVVGNPKLLICDEPTGNLDPTTSWQIIKLIKKINKLGTTVLMATHNMDIVNSLKERVIQIEEGQIKKDEKEGKYEIA